MDSKAGVNVRFPGFLSLLTLLLIALKLLEKIDWHWHWVLAPLWIPFCMTAIVVGLFAGLAALGGIKVKRKK